MSFWPKSHKARRRLTIVLAVAPVLALAVGLTLYGLRENISLFLTPGQVQTASLKPGKPFQLGGLVEAGSLKKHGEAMTFRVVDNQAGMTVVYDGEVTHRDSTGGGGTIGPGEVQWMTAASGIVHEEFHSEAYARSGGPFRMVQLWVNLPARDKMAPPGYQGITAAQIPTLPLLDLNGADAGTVRPIAGTFDGTSGPANTFTPMQVWDVQLKAGHTVTLPAPEGHTTVPLVYQGLVKTADGQEAGDAEMIVYTRDGEGVQLTALADTTLLWLCGEPIDEPVVGYGPFVMNTPQEIQQAFVDFQSGRMGRL